MQSLFTTPREGTVSRNDVRSALKNSPGEHRWTNVLEDVWFLAELSLAWWMICLAGLVVFGAAPASVAVSESLQAHAEGRVVRSFRGTFAAAWRVRGSANYRLLPLMGVQVFSVVTLVLASSGAVPAPLAMVPLVVLGVATTGWSMAASALVIAHRGVRSLPVLSCWRVALLSPGALPGAALQAVFGFVALTIVCLIFLLASVLIGPALAVLLARRTVGRRMTVLIDAASE